jgi:hypothetical protein
MSTFAKINKIVLDFLKEMLGQEAKIVSIQKQDTSWFVVAEVFEDSAFIKSIGLKTNVKDRYFYEIEIDGELEIVSYARQEGTAV